MSANTPLTPAEMRADGRTNVDAHELRQLVRQFAQEEVLPRVVEYNRRKEFPWDIFEKMGELGFLGGVIPPEYGGLGLDYATLAELIEEMARVDHALAMVMAQPSCNVGATLMRVGTEEQRQRFLPLLAQGKIVAAAAFTEPQSGTDLAGLLTTYRRDGEDYVLNGSKVWITPCDRADFYVTFATKDPSLGRKGISAFIVERTRDGFSHQPIPGLMSLQTLNSGFLHFTDCRIPVDNLLGEEGGGMRVALAALDCGRLSVAARCVGMAEECLDRSIEYAKGRIVQKQPIGRFQLIQAKLAEMAIGVDTARFVVRRLAECLDSNLKIPTYYSSSAKLHASQVAFMAANHAVQIHGGYGISDEYHVERLFRDARLYLIGEGTNEIQQVVIAEALLGYRKAGWLPDDKRIRNLPELV